MKNETEPNKAVEPTPVNVTFPAYAGTAPFTSAAHLERSAPLRCDALRFFEFEHE